MRIPETKVFAAQSVRPQPTDKFVPNLRPQLPLGHGLGFLTGFFGFDSYFSTFILLY